MVWELYFCRSGCIGCCFSCDACCNSPCKIKDQTTHPYKDPDGARASVQKHTQPDKAPGSTVPICLRPCYTKHGTPICAKPPDEESEYSRLSMSELFFHDYYAPMLNFAVGPTGPLGLRFKPCSVMFVALFGSLGGWLIAEALTLSTPDEAPVWFPADHMVTGLPDIMRTSFLSGEDDDYMRGNLYFGIQDVYAPEYSKWTPEKNRGTVVFDESFNITLPEAQTAFLQLCDDLEVEDCAPEGSSDPYPVCSRPPHTLISTGTMECFLRDFQTHLATSNLSLPTGPEFYPALKNWQDGPGGAFRRNIGWVNGTVRFISVSFRWTAPVGIPVAPMRQLYDRSKLFLTNKFQGSAPASLGEPFFYNGVFSWMETSEQLVQVRWQQHQQQAKQRASASAPRQQIHIQPLTMQRASASEHRASKSISNHPPLSPHAHRSYCKASRSSSLAPSPSYSSRNRRTPPRLAPPSPPPTPH